MNHTTGIGACDNDNRYTDDNIDGSCRKCRRTGIVTTSGHPFKNGCSASNGVEDDVQFPCVEKLIQKYTTLILEQQQQQQQQQQQHRGGGGGGGGGYNHRNGWSFNNSTFNDDDDVDYDDHRSEKFVNKKSPSFHAEFDDSVVDDDVAASCKYDNDNGTDDNGTSSIIINTTEDDVDRMEKTIALNRTSSRNRKKHRTIRRSPSQEAFLSVSGERRQTWTGPLNGSTCLKLINESDRSSNTDVNLDASRMTRQKLAVRKTCSYDQAWKKSSQYQQQFYHNHQQNSFLCSNLNFAKRATNSSRRKGSDNSVTGIGYYSCNTSTKDDFDNGNFDYYNFGRTPSVIISDHSDNASFASSTMTLEEVEFYQMQQQQHLNELDWNNEGSPLSAGGGGADSSSDCSLASSWSVGNGCINVLEDDYEIQSYEYRKISACSSCSTFSSFEDDDATPEDDAIISPTITADAETADDNFAETAILTEERERIKRPSGWRKLRSIVQWTPFFQTYKKQRYPWIQLAGHQGNFRAGREPGTILKKLCLKEEMCFQLLMKDVLKPFVPEYRGSIKTEDDERYLQLQDLLSEFSAPCVMDVKIGVRTYLEEELAKAKEKPKLRKDMYEKMIQIDPNAPSDEENRLKGVTKPRYMVWRETISSTATLGFRIEGIRKSDGKSSKDFKTTKTKDQIIEAFRDFVDGFPGVVAKYIKRLNAIKDTLEFSKFFNTHEIIGSSLLFVHDKNNASVWLIDFAKTVVLPPDVQIKHDSEWIVGNHEDGYLIGLNNLIDVFSDLVPSSSDSREIHDAI